jgi:hypothetical protein
MAKSPAKYQVYGLQENYIGLGDHVFKIVISPRFKNGQDFKVVLLDSDSKQMQFDVNYWGRKLNVLFKVNKNTPDGLATAQVSRLNEQIGSFNFWVIK